MASVAMRERWLHPPRIPLQIQDRHPCRKRIFQLLPYRASRAGNKNQQTTGQSFRSKDHGVVDPDMNNMILLVEVPWFAVEEQIAAMNAARTIQNSLTHNGSQSTDRRAIA